MGIISLASGNSCWRGLDYYKNKKVVATYFTVSPKEAINFEEEQNRLQEEYEKEQEEEYDKVIRCLNRMSKQELIEELIQVFDYGPEWIYDNFVRRNL